MAGKPLNGRVGEESPSIFEGKVRSRSQCDFALLNWILNGKQFSKTVSVQPFQAWFKFGSFWHRAQINYTRTVFRIGSHASLCDLDSWRRSVLLMRLFRRLLLVHLSVTARRSCKNFGLFLSEGWATSVFLDGTLGSNIDIVLILGHLEGQVVFAGHLLRWFETNARLTSTWLVVKVVQTATDCIEWRVLVLVEGGLTCVLPLILIGIWGHNFAVSWRLLVRWTSVQMHMRGHRSRFNSRARLFHSTCWWSGGLFLAAFHDWERSFGVVFDWLHPIKEFSLAQSGIRIQIHPSNDRN